MTQADLNALSRTAADVLANTFQQALTLAEPCLIKDKTRSLVVRCTLTSRTPTAITPTAVIIKQIRDNDMLGFSDWASLAFLSAHAATQGVAPRFLGGDVVERFFVMADLGGSQTLDDVLNGQDAQRAHTILQRLAVQMARLHVATVNTEGAFAATRAALPGAAGLGRALEAAHWLQQADKLTPWFQAAGCPLPVGFSACLREIAALYANPGPFLAFTHGDPAPSNNHIGGEQVRLVDFEYGGYRHALYDITGWNILCPLPTACVRTMRQAFQHELSIGCPPARDPVQFDQAWAMLCAFRALAVLTWIPPSVLTVNRPWVDEQWTSRHAIMAALLRCQAAVNAVPSLAPVHEAVARLGTVLQSHWPEFADVKDVATQWPALATGQPTLMDKGE